MSERSQNVGIQSAACWWMNVKMEKSHFQQRSWSGWARCPLNEQFIHLIWSWKQSSSRWLSEGPAGLTSVPSAGPEPRKGTLTHDVVPKERFCLVLQPIFLWEVVMALKPPSHHLINGNQVILLGITASPLTHGGTFDRCYVQRKL